MSTTSERPPARPVPVRTIAAVIAMVLAAAIGVVLIYAMRQVVGWLVVSIFFAAALYPVVNWTQRILPWHRRTPATLIVFLLVLVVGAGLVTLFAVPLAQQGAAFAAQVPQLITEARTGQGPIGRLLARTHALAWLQSNEPRIESFATGLTSPAANILRGLALGIAGLITVFVLALLMVLEGPKIIRGVLGMVEVPANRERLRRVGTDCSKAINGYVFGNLVMSVICGLLTYLVLIVMGVPFAGVLALLVAITDLLPIVGAVFGGLVAIAVASTHTVAAVIVVVIFLAAYQEIENHILQPVILSRTVKLNPLTVVIAFVAGFELAGILGALLAIPVAGVTQVVVRDLWASRRRLVGADELGPEDEAEVDAAIDDATTELPPHPERTEHHDREGRRLHGASSPSPID